MILLLAILLSFSPVSGCTKQGSSVVGISVVRQQKFRNSGHHPENNHRVTFRMVNKTTSPLVVFGFKYEGGFDPTGYIISFDRVKGEWTYPTHDNRPVSWSERAGEFKQTIILPPNGAITFNAEMSQREVGGHFKRTAYIASGDGEEACEVSSEEFVLQ